MGRWKGRRNYEGGEKIETFFLISREGGSKWQVQCNWCGRVLVVWSSRFANAKTCGKDCKGAGALETVYPKLWGCGYIQVRCRKCKLTWNVVTAKDCEGYQELTVPYKDCISCPVCG